VIIVKAPSSRQSPERESAYGGPLASPKRAREIDKLLRSSDLDGFDRNPELVLHESGSAKKAHTHPALTELNRRLIEVNPEAVARVTAKPA
jgi:hypothetical protein